MTVKALGAGEGGVSARWRWAMLAAALLLGCAGRLAYSWNAPLWFDETYTGVIASQPTFAGLITWCLHELTGPGYYLPLWLWEKVAGHGDLALRLPSIALSLATPLVVLRWGSRDPALRYWWAIAVLLWVPIFQIAGEARAYPLIFLLGTVQAALFVRMISGPSTSRASAWVAVSALLILCNYWGAIPSAVQGIAFLATQRQRALRTWRAVIFVIPLLAWAWFHLPFVLGLTGASSGGVGGMPLADIVRVPGMVMGIGFSATVIVAVIAGSLLWTGTRTERPPARAYSAELVLASCGVASLGIVLVLAFVRPGFAPRYAMAAMPAVLFGLALWLRWMTARDMRPAVVVLAMLFTTAVGVVVPLLTGPDKDPRHLFELERPSAWLAAAGPEAPRRLVVFWDGPIARTVPDFTLREVGAFFLRRAGREVEVSLARLPSGGDPNSAVVALAAQRRAGILWFANDALPAERQPRIERYDQRFECRNFGRGEVTMTACRWRE